MAASSSVKYLNPRHPPYGYQQGASSSRSSSSRGSSGSSYGRATGGASSSSSRSSSARLASNNLQNGALISSSNSSRTSSGRSNSTAPPTGPPHTSRRFPMAPPAYPPVKYLTQDSNGQPIPLASSACGSSKLKTDATKNAGTSKQNPKPLTVSKLLSSGKKDFTTLKCDRCNQIVIKEDENEVVTAPEGHLVHRQCGTIFRNQTSSLQQPKSRGDGAGSSSQQGGFSSSTSSRGTTGASGAFGNFYSFFGSSSSSSFGQNGSGSSSSNASSSSSTSTRNSTNPRQWTNVPETSTATRVTGTPVTKLPSKAPNTVGENRNTSQNVVVAPPRQGVDNLDTTSTTSTSSAADLLRGQHALLKSLHACGFSSGQDKMSSGSGSSSSLRGGGHGMLQLVPNSPPRTYPRPNNPNAGASPDLFKMKPSPIGSSRNPNSNYQMPLIPNHVPVQETSDTGAAGRAQVSVSSRAGSGCAIASAPNNSSTTTTCSSTETKNLLQSLEEREKEEEAAYAAMDEDDFAQLENLQLLDNFGDDSMDVDFDESTGSNLQQEGQLGADLQSPETCESPSPAPGAELHEQLLITKGTSSTTPPERREQEQNNTTTRNTPAGSSTPRLETRSDRMLTDRQKYGTGGKGKNGSLAVMSGGVTGTGAATGMDIDSMEDANDDEHQGPSAPLFQSTGCSSGSSAAGKSSSSMNNVQNIGAAQEPQVNLPSSAKAALSELDRLLALEEEQERKAERAARAKFGIKSGRGLFEAAEAAAEMNSAKRRKNSYEEEEDFL
ncbi:unnamed protein product [Amoebophrya sp. A120]|nr:unnamed protein product [Amoebophrya sp. A120]|eukprot:GSA120T00007250001.1